MWQRKIYVRIHATKPDSLMEYVLFLFIICLQNKNTVEQLLDGRLLITILTLTILTNRQSSKDPRIGSWIQAFLRLR